MLKQKCEHVGVLIYSKIEAIFYSTEKHFPFVEWKKHSTTRRHKWICSLIYGYVFDCCVCYNKETRFKHDLRTISQVCVCDVN